MNEGKDINEVKDVNEEKDMNKEETKVKSSRWTISGSIVGAMLITFLLFVVIFPMISLLIISGIGIFLGYEPVYFFNNISELAHSDFAVFLLSTYGIIDICLLLFLLFLLLRHKDILKTLLPGYKCNNGKSFLIGCLLGFAGNGLGILVAILTGSISLKFTGMNIGFAIVSFILLAGQCIGEEVALRGFLYRTINKRHSAFFAVIFSSLLFAIFHLGNRGIGILALINLFLIAVFFAETVFYFDSIFIAYGFHILWNYTQNFIFGLPNSGIKSFYSFFGIDTQYDSIFYSTVFGIESTVTTTVVLLVGIVILTIIGQKKKNIFGKDSITPVIE